MVTAWKATIVCDKFNIGCRPSSIQPNPGKLGGRIEHQEYCHQPYKFRLRRLVSVSFLHTPSTFTMPPNVASLTDLVSYTADQEEQIKRVFVAGEKERKTGRKGTFRDACAAWETFRRSVWGYGLGFFDTEEAGFDRGDDPIDDFSIKSEDPFNPPLDPELPPSQPSFDLVPARRQVMKIPPTLFEASGARSDRILIRSEYGHAERAALLARGSGAQAFLVTGQPGIGLFPFLHPWHVLMFFPRKVCLLVSSPHSASLPRASHCATTGPELCTPFSQRWRV